jgi:glycosyltransferase involved in cell wall biosynthesis
MRVGFDITDLYVAQAGVYYYRYNLLRAMLQLNSPQFEFSLLDYFPIHGGWIDRPEVEALSPQTAPIRHIRGLRHRKLARLWFLQKPIAEQMAQVVDKALLFPWEMLANSIMKRQLHIHLEGVDIFHASEVLNYAEPGVKTVATIYDMTTVLFPEYHTTQTKALQAEKFRFVREKADAVIAISASARQDAIEYLDIKPERIHVVYAGVDPKFRPLPVDEVAPVLARHELRPDGYILHVSTIEPRKNLVRLLQAYQAVWQRQPQSTPQLALAGATGWFFREVFDKVQALGLTEQVRFLGRVDDADLPALYNGALFLAYPTLYEGFGLPALEAMACGTAVLTSNVSSLPEIVGQAGVYVEPKDIESITQGLRLLLDDNQLRQELVEKGVERAKSFNWRKAAEETTAVYTNLIN